MNDVTRAAIMALATSLLNMLVLLQVLYLSEIQLSGINLFVGNLVLLIALVWKTGQGKAPLSTSITHLPHDDHSGYHAIKVDKDGNIIDEGNKAAVGVLGLFWFDGRVEVEQSLVSNPALFKEVFLSEGAHATDFFYLWPNNLRKPLYDIYHPNGPDQHGHFEGPYFDTVGEAFMGGFVYATTDKPPSLLGFSHVTTKEVAAKIKTLLKIEEVKPPVQPPVSEPTLKGATRAEFEAEFNRRYGYFKSMTIEFTATPDVWKGSFVHSNAAPAPEYKVNQY